MNLSNLSKANGNRQYIWLIMIATAIFCESCKKLVEIAPPVDSTTQSQIYSENSTAIASLTAIFTNMTNTLLTSPSPFTGNRSISLFSGLSADELTLYNGVTSYAHLGYYKNQLKASPSTQASGVEHWEPLYNFVFKCNAAIEGLTSSSANNLEPTIKQQLLGEAKFLRAFFYFYLTNLYGDVPLALSTDYKMNSSLAKSPRNEVYQRIITDLTDAKELLTNDYLDATLLNSSSERTRPTKWVASALLARVYLYVGDFANAEINATTVITNSGLYSLSPLNDVFLKNSSEAIWQLQPTTLYFNTEDARTFIIPSSGLTDGDDASNPVYLSSQLLGSFEANDQRATIGNWINSITLNGIEYYFPYKYKNNMEDISITGYEGLSEYLMVLRLSEQYLIRAEARAQQNNIAGAQSDLNAVRTRAGLANTSADSKTSLLPAILHERQIELFSEWGHRWMDLKRTGNIDDVMSIVTPVKSDGTAWQNYQQWYPIPVGDLQKAPNLIQNNGY